MSLSHEDVKTILATLNESDCEEAELQFGDLKLRWRRHGDSSRRPEKRPLCSDSALLPRDESETSTSVAAAAVPAKEREDALPEGVEAITAPMLGTFYRAASPGDKPFVERGDRIGPDDTVCLLEVMKLFNSVKAGIAGTVERILVENGTLVEYGQRLMFIRKNTALAQSTK